MSTATRTKTKTRPTTRTARKPQRLPERYRAGFLRDMDRRTEVFARLSAIYDVVADEAGGRDNLPHTKLALIERFVFLEAALQTWEAQIATDPKASADLVGKWIQGANSLMGLAKTIGLERHARNVVDLKAYIGKGRDDERD